MDFTEDEKKALIAQLETLRVDLNMVKGDMAQRLASVLEKTKQSLSPVPEPEAPPSIE